MTKEHDCSVLNSCDGRGQQTPGTVLLLAMLISVALSTCTTGNYLTRDFRRLSCAFVVCKTVQRAGLDASWLLP